MAALITLISIDMGWNNVLSQSRNALVFQGKLKEYGAYKIRKAHGVNLAVALAATVSIAGVGFGAPVYFGEHTDH